LGRIFRKKERKSPPKVKECGSNFLSSSDCSKNDCELLSKGELESDLKYFPKKGYTSSLKTGSVLNYIKKLREFLEDFKKRLKKLHLNQQKKIIFSKSYLKKNNIFSYKH